MLEIFGEREGDEVVLACSTADYVHAEACMFHVPRYGAKSRFAFGDGDQSCEKGRTMPSQDLLATRFKKRRTHALSLL